MQIFLNKYGVLIMKLGYYFYSVTLPFIIVRTSAMLVLTFFCEDTCTTIKLSYIIQSNILHTCRY